MNSRLKKLVMAAVLAALTTVATMVIKIPSPLHGYINLGDCVVLAAGWLLSPAYGFLAAAIGSALADVFAGYALYAPATFVIKGIMAIIAYLCQKCFNNKFGNTPARVIGGILAEIAMILGYFVFEGFLYGFAPSLINIPPNAVQGIAGIIIGIILIKIFEKTKMF